MNENELDDFEEIFELKLKGKEFEKWLSKWFKKVQMATLDNLQTILLELKDFEKDYRTAMHIIAFAAIAAANAMNNQPDGNLCGSQATNVKWEFIKGWDDIGEEREAPRTLLDYRYLLSPQHSYMFEPITNDVWKWVQDKARKKIESVKNRRWVDLEELKHWQSIVNGNVPFGLKVLE